MKTVQTNYYGETGMKLLFFFRKEIMNSKRAMGKGSRGTNWRLQ